MLSNRQIADSLNELAATLPAPHLMQTTISRKHGAGDAQHVSVALDTFPGEVAVDLIGPRGRAWLPAEVAAVLSNDPQLGLAIAALEHAHGEATRIPELVRDCRDAGATWKAVGDVLGVTKQSAQERFGGA